METLEQNDISLEYCLR